MREETRLFAYGTLLSGTGDRVLDRWIPRHLEDRGPGEVRGWAGRIGPWPALRLDPRGRRVRGRILRIREPERTLARLDDYEEFAPNDPERSLYLRTEVLVRRPGGREARCWIYVAGPAARWIGRGCGGVSVSS